jgi:hypothetical protein
MIVNSPMVITPKEARLFGQLFLYLLFMRRERPKFGHFNFMQRFEYWAVFWGIPIMGFSGLVLWKAAGFSEYASGRMLNFAYIIHSDEAFLAFIYIAVVHIFSVILTPAVFPLSRGTLSGVVPADELVEGHLGELEAVAQRLGVTAEEVVLPPWGPGRIAKGLMKRGYSLVLLSVCAVLCFISMRFLFGLLLERQAAPTEIVEIPKRLDAETLATSFSKPGAGAKTKAEAPRGPLAHFHEIPTWFQPDPGNNCTVSGCHGPLPHGRRVEVRAFLNMHTTFVDCAVCHASDADQVKNAKWFSLADRQGRAAPAVIHLAGEFERWGEDFSKDPAAIQAQLLPLIRQAVEDSGGNTQLSEWALRLETTYVGSESWRNLVKQIQDNLHLHAHGEYNAKIGLYQGPRLLGTPTDPQAKATGQYLSGKKAMTDEQKQSLLTTIHQGVRPAGALCTPCHSAQATRINLSSLGYSTNRAESLQSSLIVQMMLSIERGQPFHLPAVMEKK